MTRPHRSIWLAGVVALLALAALTARARLSPAQPAQALGLPAGWNLIADPNGIVTTGPAFTYQIGDTDYESVAPGTPLTPGLGYWVQSQGASALPLGAGSPTATLLTTPGQFIMVGNPSGILPAQVTGADILLTYSPAGGYHYQTDGMLQPGQGAWALSYAGTPISIAAQGTTTGTCSTAETGSACAVGGACPQDYPVAITADAVAHPQPGPGDPALQQPAVLCFNSLQQALSAGYQLAPRTRITINGPASATVSGIRFTVTQAMLESPDAFMARTLASGDQLCTGCNISGATAVVTVDYGVENLNRPATLISTGSFVSEHPPVETAPSYFLLQSQQAIDPVHTGVPVGGAVSGVFARSPFATIDQVNWRLDTPLIDASTGIGQPHGPSILFELDFRGPNAGQIIAYGGGSTPLPPYNPNNSVVPPLVTATPSTTPGSSQPPAPPVAPAAPAAAPATPSAPPATPASTPAPSTAPAATPAGASVNPSAPFTR